MEEINFFKDINDNYSNIITAISTVIYLFITIWLIVETRIGRKKMEEPYIEVFLRRIKHWGSMLEIVVKNIGYSGAYEIKIDKIREDFHILSKDNNFTFNNIGFIKNGISFLPVNGERSNSAIIMSDNYEEKIKLKFELNCSYKDKYGKKYKEKFLLDLSEFENTFLPQEEPIYKIEKSIKKIEGVLSKIGSGFTKINIITQSKNEYRKEQQKKYEEYKNNCK